MDQLQNFNDISGLKLHSIGIVVEDIDPTDPEGKVKVSPIEGLNIQTPGPIAKFKDEYVSEHPDESGVITEEKLTATSYVIAKWRPLFNPNRSNPPTVRKNETVILVKYSNVEEYYWTTLSHESHLRGKEIGRYSFSNLDRSGGNFTPYGDDTSYWFEVDTINKRVKLKTSDNDGEAAGYEVVFNTAEGTFEIKDTEGNLLKWESVEGTLTLNFKKTVTIKAGNEIILDAPKTIVTGDLIVGGTIVNGGGVSSSGGFMGKSFTEVDLDGPF